MGAPVKKFKSSLAWGVSLNIWENDKGYTFSLDKSYKKDGEYKQSSSLFANELAAIATVLIPQALKWVDENWKAKGSDSSATSTEATSVAFDADDLPAGF